MAKDKAAVRRVRARDDEALDFFDVPATVLCALCGKPDCMGCAPGDESGSGVVAIVPWERPGAGVWSRLWSTANATTLGAESFFAALPDGELRAAVRFALLAETLAILSMMAVLLPLAILALPNLMLEVIANPSMRVSALRWMAMSVPLLATWMVIAHTTHGAILNVGARRQGARSQQRRAVRFGLYACGWDLMAGPLGAAVTFASKGRAAMLEVLALSMTVPGKASLALLRGVYGLGGDAAAKARRHGTIAAGVLTVASGLIVVALVFVL